LAEGINIHDVYGRWLSQSLAPCWSPLCRYIKHRLSERWKRCSETRQMSCRVSVCVCVCCWLVGSL